MSETPDPLRDALDELAAIPTDVVPTRGHRPTKAVVKRLLAANGKPVSMTNTDVVEDVDGIPAGTETTTTTATLDVDLHQLGWTEAEYRDPNITE